MKETAPSIALTDEELANAHNLLDTFSEEFKAFDNVYGLTTRYFNGAQMCSANQKIASAILKRGIEAARSARLLASVGLTADASVACRILLEACAILGNAAKDSGFLETFVLSSLLDKKRLHDGLHNSPEDKNISNDKVYEALKDEIKTKGAKKLPSVEQLLASVGMTSAYNFAYRVQSRDVHVCPAGLERYLPEKGSVRYRNYPHVNEVSTVLWVGAIELLGCLSSWAKILGLEGVEESATMQKLVMLQKKRKQSMSAKKVGGLGPSP